MTALGSVEISIQALGAIPVVEHSEQPSPLQVRQRADVAQAAGEQRVTVTDGRQRPTSSMPIADSALRSSVGRSGVPTSSVTVAGAPVPDRRARHTAGPTRRTRPSTTGHRGRDTSRQSHVLPDREDHWPARAPQLGRQLHAGRRRADDEHAAVGKLAGSR